MADPLEQKIQRIMARLRKKGYQGDIEAEARRRAEGRGQGGQGQESPQAGGQEASFRYGKGLGGAMQKKQGGRLQKLLASVANDPKFQEIMGGAKKGRFGYSELEQLANSGLLTGDRATQLLGNLLGTRPEDTQAAPPPGGGGGAAPPAGPATFASGGGGGGGGGQTPAPAPNPYEDRISELMARIDELEGKGGGSDDYATPPPGVDMPPQTQEQPGGPGWEPPPLTPGGVWNWQQGDNMYQLLPPHVQAAMRQVWESFGIPTQQIDQMTGGGGAAPPIDAPPGIGGEDQGPPTIGPPMPPVQEPPIDVPPGIGGEDQGQPTIGPPMPPPVQEPGQYLPIDDKTTPWSDVKHGYTPPPPGNIFDLPGQRPPADRETKSPWMGGPGPRPIMPVNPPGVTTPPQKMPTRGPSYGRPRPKKPTLAARPPGMATPPQQPPQASLTGG